MTPRTKYRGKYPNRINSVSSTQSKLGMLVVTNAGDHFMIRPATPQGAAKAPKPGIELSHYENSADYIASKA